MFSFSKKISSNNGTPSVPELTTLPFPMGLEERKAIRREMLYQAIRQSMQSLGVSANLYRFKVINVDSRHHRFLAMIEVTANFEAKKGGSRQSFIQIESLIKENAYADFGILVAGIFWRVSESEKAFASKFREGDSAQNDASNQVAAQWQARRKVGGKDERLARRKVPTVTADEHQDSRNASGKRKRTSSTHIEDTVFDSEPPALDDKPMPDGTPVEPPA
jgi:hypothetical protein